MKALESKMLIKHGTIVTLTCLTPVEEASFERQVMTTQGVQTISVGVMILTVTVDATKLTASDYVQSKDGSTAIGTQTHRLFACKFRHPDTGKVIYLKTSPQYKEYRSQGATFCTREEWEQLKTLLGYTKGCSFPLPGVIYGKIKLSQNQKDPTAPPANYLEKWGGAEMKGPSKGQSLMDEDEGEAEDETPQGGLMDEDEHQEQQQPPQNIQQAAAAAAQAAPTPTPAAPASTPPQQQAPAPASTTGKPRRGQQAAS